MESIIGYCKECGKTIFESNKIEGCKHIYECPVCGYPHIESDLWSIPPVYLNNNYKNKE